MAENISLKENPEQSLYTKVVKGGFWVFSQRLIHQLLYLGRLVILARLLAPHDFGLLGIALVTMAILNTFSTTGFMQALIQKKEKTEDYLDSVWTVLILRGFILFIILYFISPYAANFFNEPEAKLIIQVVGLSMLLGAFTNVGVIYFQKELEFKKQFIFQLSGTGMDFLVAVTSAFILRNAWALVLGFLVGNAVRLVLSYFIHPYRPHLCLDFDKIKELFNYGKWILGAVIITFFVVQGDDIFLSKVLGVTALGFYQIAFKLGNMPATEIAGVIRNVAFPAYSKLQSSLPQIKEAYLRVMTFASIIFVPLTGGIIVLAPQAIKIFLGEQWLPVVIPLQILAVSGMVRCFMGFSGPLFLAIGKPKINFKLNLIRLIVMVMTIYPLTFVWKISGTSLSVLLSIVTASFVCFWVTIKELNIKVRYYLFILIPPIIATLTMCVTISCFLNLLVLVDNELLNFVISVLAGLIVYLFGMFLNEKLLNHKGLQEIRLIVKNLRLKTS